MTESLIFAGTPENAAKTLEYLVENGFEISLVITRTDAQVGRKRVLTPSAVAIAADRLGLAVHKTNKVDGEAIERISQTGSNAAVVVAFGALLKPPALESLANGWFNLHYSLLPMWRGAAPVQHAILAGDRTTGVTLFKIDEGLDTGDVVDSVPTQIQSGETSDRLLARLTELGCSLLSQALPGILLGSHELRAQDVSQGSSLAPKLSRQDAHIDWQTSAEKIERQILAMNSKPGAWASLNGDTFKIHDGRKVATLEIHAPGGVWLSSGKVLVGTADGVVELLTVQPAGKPLMQATEWARGASLPLRFDA
jgi:methionyl-tRNA formyltransferase